MQGNVQQAANGESNRTNVGVLRGIGDDSSKTVLDTL